MNAAALADRSPPPGRLVRIVAGTDFSVAAAQALSRAAELARTHGAHLLLVHVVPSALWEDAGIALAATVGATMPSPQALQLDAQERLEREAQDLAAHYGLSCSAEAAWGRPAVELGRRAAAADLLVVGGHGAHPQPSPCVGATAQKLLRLAPSPVLIVKRDPVHEYRTLLLPTDFSAPARAALVATAAWWPHARLHLAHAFELPADGYLRHADIDVTAVAAVQAAARARLLGELAAWADGAGVDLARRRLHVEHGYAPERIDRWARTLHADLVAIAAHGRAELERALLGSVSLHTALAAPCDVLLLRADAA